VIQKEVSLYQREPFGEFVPADITLDSDVKRKESLVIDSDLLQSSQVSCSNKDVIEEQRDSKTFYIQNTKQQIQTEQIEYKINLWDTQGMEKI